MKNVLKLMFLVLLCPCILYSQDVRITGKVTGAQNENLSGVSVTVNGTSRGTTTNTIGTFAIDASPNVTLVFSSVGYAEQRVNIGNRNVINVKMVANSSNLQDVVVTALGIRKEAKRLGYATATV